MVFEFEIITLLIGAIYGYLKPGREDRMALFKKGVLIGIILALILVGLGVLMGGGFMMLVGSGVVGAFVFVEVIILAAFFIIGTFIGDWLEEKSKAA